MSKNDKKLPYLHKITKRKFLVSNKNMRLCQFIRKIKTCLFKMRTIRALLLYYRPWQISTPGSQIYPNLSTEWTFYPGKPEQQSPATGKRVTGICSRCFFAGLCTLNFRFFLKIRSNVSTRERFTFFIREKTSQSRTAVISFLKSVQAYSGDLNNGNIWITKTS